LVLGLSRFSHLPREENLSNPPIKPDRLPTWPIGTSLAGHGSTSSDRGKVRDAVDVLDKVRFV
jgi:hypothetical protein